MLRRFAVVQLIGECIIQWHAVCQATEPSYSVDNTSNNYKWMTLQVLCDYFYLYHGTCDFDVIRNFLSFSFFRKYEEFSAPSVEEFCIITDGTYQKTEVFVSHSLMDYSTYMQRAIELPGLTSSCIHRFWKWSIKCLMTWDFIYLSRQQRHFSGYSLTTHILTILFSKQSRFFTNMLYLVFLNFDQEIH